MLRTSESLERRRSEVADLLVLPRPAESLQNGACFSGKLEQTGLVKKERVTSAPQRLQLARTPEPTFSKGKRTERSVQITRS